MVWFRARLREDWVRHSSASRLMGDEARLNSAHKGRRNEHKAREWLEALGFTVTRSAASKGAWDLVGLSFSQVALAQVKSNEWPGPAERAALAAFPAPPCSRRLMFRYDDRKPVRVRELLNDGQWVDVI